VTDFSPGFSPDFDVLMQDIEKMPKNFSGKMICLEGIEGVGKTTQINWIADFLKENGKKVIITREPGGTPIGEKIRDELLKHDMPGESLTNDVEMLLVFAARSQHMAHKILPALKEGVWVVCSRFFESSFAYQGGGRGIDTRRVDALKKWVMGDFTPDLTFLLDLPVNLSRDRVSVRGEELDRFESQKDAFFERVRQMYLRRSELDENMHIIDASVNLTGVQQQMEPILKDLLGQSHE
jgi:dTMP kinase